jgi:hypothetical protein
MIKSRFYVFLTVAKLEPSLFMSSAMQGATTKKGNRQQHQQSVVADGTINFA